MRVSRGATRHTSQKSTDASANTVVGVPASSLVSSSTSCQMSMRHHSDAVYRHSGPRCCHRRPRLNGFHLASSLSQGLSYQFTKRDNKASWRANTPPGRTAAAAAAAGDHRWPPRLAGEQLIRPHLAAGMQIHRLIGPASRHADGLINTSQMDPSRHAHLLHVACSRCITTNV